jgi:predicted methyltransferase
MKKEIDLKLAINAISDVVQNRPRPIRQFDQIYMKTGDMVLQSEFIAAWANGKRIAFVGDGDAISVCVAYLRKRNIIDYGPSKIVVFDFDERIVQAVKRFADKERLDELDAVLYNCLDVFPQPSRFDAFYTNPPWGASNNGESVNLFTERGMEATGYTGCGQIVIADDEELDWPKEVLASTQAFVLAHGHYVSRMMPRMHLYHLDDAPNLRSCNLEISAVPGRRAPFESLPVTDPERLRNFYGRSKQPRVKYIREIKRLEYGNAYESEYRLDLLEESA